METNESTDPLPDPGDKEDYDGETILTVGLTYNLKKGIQSEIEDIEAEYDTIETVMAIKQALEEMNCRVELLEADSLLFGKLQKTKVDIVFNIAEGIYGRGREAQVPAILNFLKIPYTGSDETTLCISLDKALTKRILRTFNIKTPRYKVFNEYVKWSGRRIGFPLIVKPNAEGSSKGISDAAVVYDDVQLEQLLKRNIELYKQSMLVEEYIQGREFTVAIVGNGREKTVLPPMEIVYKDKEERYNIYSYNVKKNYKKYVDYICPALIDRDMESKMMKTAGKIYDILECRDFSRVDFRVSCDGEIYFIEINPLPGLAPGYSDFPMIAGFNGIEYKNVIKMILNSGLKRHGMEPIA